MINYSTSLSLTVYVLCFPFNLFLLFSDEQAVENYHFCLILFSIEMLRT